MLVTCEEDLFAGNWPLSSFCTRAIASKVPCPVSDPKHRRRLVPADHS